MSGIDVAPWLPHERCGRLAPDCTCTCHPVTVERWEQVLEISRNQRLAQQHAADYDRLHQRWAA